jgi:hypothetical protein
MLGLCIEPIVFVSMRLPQLAISSNQAKIKTSHRVYNAISSAISDTACRAVPLEHFRNRLRNVCRRFVLIVKLTHVFSRNVLIRWSASLAH